MRTFLLNMKKFLLLFALIFCVKAYSQLDTDHWFAPFAARAGISQYEGALYLSTNETTPFTVQVFNNNTLFSTVTVSKGSPAQVSIPSSMMISSAQSQIHTTVNKGLYLKGSQKFYASYRFAVQNHAEIITSKGLAGLGTNFHTAMAPLTSDHFATNSTIGVIATENNTTVTISDYAAGLDFTDGYGAPTRTFALNRGQSFIMETSPVGNPANMDGLVGAKIVADKAISVTNGNFNGIYTNFNFSNQDILMDQAVPLDRLGKQFGIVMGNGTPTSGMEAVLVVATVNNTQLTVNGNPYGTVLNSGDYALIPGTNYVSHATLHYNLGISSNENIYVYQLLAGASNSSEYPAGGFNYIPPLSCFLPNKVDEIGNINQMISTTYETKLNILTQAGAVVTVNGNPLAALNGPYPLPGNPQWVTYSVNNVTGNITVNSTKSVTAGIAAGSGAVGYGGYFAGFSSVPVIAKSGDCYNGVLLQVDNSYDSYQWLLNGVPIAGATSFSINPQLYGSGSYTVLITKNNCETKLTEPYNFVVCPPIPTTTVNIGSCNVYTVTPAFSTSTQTILPNKTAIIALPANGTATVNPATGIITYTPNPALTTDTTYEFVYYIEGNSNPADTEYFKVVLNIDVLQTTNAALTECASPTGTATFDLTAAVVTPDTGTTAAYFTDVAMTNQITTPSAFITAGATVYVRVTSAFGCTKNAQISLTVNPAANMNTSTFNGALCDDNFDGIINVDFAAITPQITANSATLQVRYYLTSADATAGNANNLPLNWSYNATTTVYVRVEPLTGGCPAVFGQLNFSIGPKLNLTSVDYQKIVCDTGAIGSEMVDLNTYKPQFTADAAVNLSFHSTLADAQNNANSIAANQNIAGTQVYYIRFTKSGECPNVAKLTLTLETVTATNAALTECAGSNGGGLFDLTTANVTNFPGAVITYFSDAALTSPIGNPVSYSAFSTTVYALITSPNGCTATASIVLTVNPLPNVNTNNFNAALCDENFDGIVNVNFASITPQIVNTPASFQVRYYLNQADANAGNANTLPNIWNYNAPTTVYVRVDGIAGSCSPAFGQINFTIGNKIPLNTQNGVLEICDSNLDGFENVNLQSFVNLFTLNPTVSATFHTTLSDAQNDVNPINNTQTLTAVHTFFIRFESSSGLCPATATLQLTLKAPKSSTTLADQTICPGTTTILDAGAGFTSYNWSTGATTQTVSVGVGTYFVDLGFNGCIYRQYVTVNAADTPVITKIDVTGNTATIFVTGGLPPYEYSVDGSPYQASNVFHGLGRGLHTATVRSADRCFPVSKEFLVLDLINAITPNGDGLNDVLDYRDLRVKENVSIEISDRYGAIVYKSANKNYVWDGKAGGRPLSSGTYWYIIRWTEPDTKDQKSYSGWILLKNIQ